MSLDGPGYLIVARSFLFMCNKCPRRQTCTRKEPCKVLERELIKATKSTAMFKKAGCDTSNHLVSFVDPAIIETMVSADTVIWSESKTRNSKYRKKLAGYFESLSEMQRKCVFLYYGLLDNNPISQPKIAKKIGVSQNTVKYHLQTARKLLLVKLMGK